MWRRRRREGEPRDLSAEKQNEGDGLKKTVRTTFRSTVWLACGVLGSHDGAVSSCRPGSLFGGINCGCGGGNGGWVSELLSQKIESRLEGMGGKGVVSVCLFVFIGLSRCAWGMCHPKARSCPTLFYWASMVFASGHGQT